MEVKIGCQYEIPVFIELLMQFAERLPFLTGIVNRLLNNYTNLPGSMRLCLYRDRNGLPDEKFVCTTVQLEKVAWEASWVEFDFTDQNIELGETYYLVCYNFGGDAANCYRWSYADSDVFGEGHGMVSDDGGETWQTQMEWDFCFKTYADFTGDEPNGIVDCWAVVVGISAYETSCNLSFSDDNAREISDVLSASDGTKYGPATSFKDILRSIALDENRVLSIAAPYENKKIPEKVIVGIPQLVGRNLGFTLEKELAPNEKEELEKAAIIIHKTYATAHLALHK